MPLAVSLFTSLIAKPTALLWSDKPIFAFSLKSLSFFTFLLKVEPSETCTTYLTFEQTRGITPLPCGLSSDTFLASPHPHWGYSALVRDTRSWCKDREIFPIPHQFIFKKQANLKIILHIICVFSIILYLCAG